MRVSIFVLMLFAASSAVAQTQVAAGASDSRAVTTLQQVLAVSGTAVAPVQAFSATGTITYYWAGQPVQGAATIVARGNGQFRLDVLLPDGTRSFVSGRQGGARKNQDGKVVAIPAHNSLSNTILTLPYPSIAAALADSACTLTLVGQVTINGKNAYQIRVIRNFDNASDPDGTLSALSRTDYYVDAQSFLVLRIEDLTHPAQSASESYSHTIDFDGYAAMRGVAVPTHIREKVAGQTTWDLQIASINFNPSLSDADFVLQ